MAEELNRWFFERGNAYGQQAHKKMLYNSKHQGNTMTYHLIHVRMAIINTHTHTHTQITNVGQGKKKSRKKKMEHFYPSANISWWSHCRKQYRGFSKD